MRLVRTFAVLSSVAVVALGGCGTAHASGPPGPVNASGLIGSWTVTEAAGVPAATVLELGADQTLKLGPSFGGWKAGGGAFVADVQARHGDGSDTSPIITPEWLATASRAESTGTDVLLRTDDGRTTARLRPAGGQQAPVVDDPAPLPAGLRPAERAELVGHWVPADGSGARAPKRPSFTLAVDGSYVGTDGCNGTGGRWANAADGALIATSGVSTLMACDGMLGVPSWLGQAARAGFDGDVLVLVDAAGAETGRVRAG